VRALEASVAVAALVAAGCSLMPAPSVPDVSPTLSQASDQRGTTFGLQPWPLDDSAAFLCLAEPGDEFTVAHPVPAPAAECTPLVVDQLGDHLAARFDVSDIPPPLQQAFARSSSPWFLAVAGSRGPLSSSMVLTIAPSPIPSDAGPS